MEGASQTTKESSLNDDMFIHYEHIQETFGSSSKAVFQVERIRDISVPSAAPASSKPLLQVTLTNGWCSVFAILLEVIEGLNIDTLPGSKVLIDRHICEKSVAQSLTQSEGTFLLSSSHCSVLGGHVKAIVVEWEKEKLAKERYLEDRLKGGQQAASSKPPRFLPLHPQQIEETVVMDVQSTDQVVHVKEITEATKSYIPNSVNDLTLVNKVDTVKPKKKENKKESGKDKDSKKKKSKKPVHREITAVVSGFVVFSVHGDGEMAGDDGDGSTPNLFLLLEGELGTLDHPDKGSKSESIVHDGPPSPLLTCALVKVCIQIQEYLLSGCALISNSQLPVVTDRLKALTVAFHQKQHRFVVELHSKDILGEGIHLLAAHPSCENSVAPVIKHGEGMYFDKMLPLLYLKAITAVTKDEGTTEAAEEGAAEEGMGEGVFPSSGGGGSGGGDAAGEQQPT